MIKHLKKLAVINDTTTDEVAILSNVTEGPDGAATFGVDNDIARLTIEDNQSIHDRIERSLDIRTLVGTATEETNLDGYVSSMTEVYVAGLGIDGFVLIGDKEQLTEATRMTKKTQYGNNDVWEVMVTKTVLPGHDPDTGLFESGFWVGRNGLGAYLWGDADSDGIADGWSAAGFSTTSFASGQQTLEADTTVRTFTRGIWFPFEGVELTFSIDNDSRTGTYSTEQIQIQFFDTSGSSISATTQTFSSTGRKSVTATTPSGSDLAYLECQVDLQASSGTVTSVVSDPALRIGTSTTYTRN